MTCRSHHEAAHPAVTPAPVRTATQESEGARKAVTATPAPARTAIQENEDAGKAVTNTASQEVVGGTTTATEAHGGGI